MVLGENGNWVNSGPKLAKNNGNPKISRIVSPNSDKVQGIVPVTEIDLNQSKVRTSPSFQCLVTFDCTNINHFSENSIRNTNATKIQITSNCNLSQ